LKEKKNGIETQNETKQQQKKSHQMYIILIFECDINNFKNK